MNWIKLTEALHNTPVWVNMRTHDYLRRHPAKPLTTISVHDGGHIEVVETPDDIQSLLLQAAEQYRRSGG